MTFGFLRTGGEKKPDVDELLDDLSRTASTSPIFNEVWPGIVDAIRPLVPFDRIAVGAVDDQAETFTEEYVFGLEIEDRSPGEPHSTAETVTAAAISGQAAVLEKSERLEEILGRFPGARAALKAGIRSFIAVPMTAGEGVAAALVIESVDHDAHSERHLRIVQRIGARILGAYANSRRFADAARETKENSALAEIGRHIAGLRELSDLKGIETRARDLIPFDRLTVTVLDREGHNGTDAFVNGAPVAGWGEGRTFDVEGTPFETVRDSRSILVVNADSPAELSGKLPTEAPGTASGYRSLMAVPLVSENRVVGAVTFRSTTADAYTDRHEKLAELFALQIVGSVANAQVFSRIRRSSEIDTVLADIGRLIHSAHELQDAFGELAGLLRILIPLEHVVVAAINAGEREVVIEYAGGAEPAGMSQGDALPLSEKMVDALVETRSGLVASSDELEVSFPDWPFLAAAGIQSIAAAPLIAGEEAFAVIMLLSTSERSYSDEDLDLLGRVAAQVAGPIAGTRANTRLATEAAEAEFIGKAAELASPACQTGDYEGLAEHVAELLPFDRLELEDIDLNNQQVVGRFAYGGGPDGGLDVEPRPLAKSLSERVVGSAEPVIVQAPENGEPAPDSLEPAVEAVLRSFLVVPLAAGDTVVGALTLSSASVEYEERMLDLAGRVGAVLGGPLAEAQSREELSRRAAEAELVAKLARLTASSSNTATYEAIAEQIQSRIPFDRLEVATFEGEDGTLRLTFAAGVDLAESDDWTVKPLAGSVYEEAFRQGVGFVLRQPENEDGEAGLQSYLVVPLASNNEIAGGLLLASTNGEAYGDRELALAARVGLQLAGALTKPFSRRGHEPDRDELVALAEMGRTLTSSIDLDEVYDRFAELAGQLVHYDRLAIWTIDLERKNLVCSFVRGVDVPGAEQGKVIPLHGLAPAMAVSLSSKLVVEDGPVDALGEGLQDVVRGTAAALPAMLLVPLVVDRETVGMLGLSSVRPNAYSERDISMAESVGAQIAGAVANGQLYRESREVEEAVRQVVERLDLAMEGSGELLWDWRISENEVWWSPKYHRAVGDPMAGPQGIRGDWQERLHPDDSERVLTALKRHLDSGDAYDVRYRYRTDAGEYLMVADRANAVRDQEGQPVRMAGSLRDITEVDDESLHGYQGPHDLAAALAITQRFRDAVLAVPDDETEEATYASTLASAGEPVARLITDLQRLAGVADVELTRESVDLRSLARAAIRRLRKAHPDRTVTTTVATKMTVNGDRELLRLMLGDLLDNAWKFTAEREDPSVDVGWEEQDGETRYYVRDNGVGFDEADTSRLFGIFQRLHANTDFEGIGVGLATVRHIVQLHGGRVWAEGEIDGGATFYYTLSDS